MPILRSAFIALSRNRMMRRFSESSSVGRRLSSRFVAGLELEDALRVAEAVNRQGMAVTLDSLGESVSTEVEAHQAVVRLALDVMLADYRKTVKIGSSLDRPDV